MVLALAIGVIVILSPIVYCSILPKYIKGLLAAHILFIGAFFICQIRIGINYLVAINKQNVVFILVLFGLVLNVMLSIVFVKLNMNIEGVALSTSVSGCLLSISVWLMVFKNIGLSNVKQVKEITLLFVPFFLMVILLSPFWLRSDIFYKGQILLKIVYLTVFICIYLFSMVFLPPFKNWTKEILLMIK